MNITVQYNVFTRFVPLFWQYIRHAYICCILYVISENPGLLTDVTSTAEMSVGNSTGQLD